LPVKQEVVGSSPISTAKSSRDRAAAARLVHNQKVEGSSPSPATNGPLARRSSTRLITAGWWVRFPQGPPKSIKKGRSLLEVQVTIMRIRKNHLTLIHDLEFRNTTESKLTLDDVNERILRFMKMDPMGSYTLEIGTDSQVHDGYTKFITGIIIARKGKGAWACYRQIIVPREIDSVKEKLSTETSYSEEIAAYFDEDRRRAMEDIILPYIYHGASFEAFINIDAGSDILRNKTAPYVKEMVRRAESMGMLAKIKPDSIAASCYANRYTKKPYRAIAAR
jgi:uncharacterized protein